MAGCRNITDAHSGMFNVFTLLQQLNVAGMHAHTYRHPHWPLCTSFPLSAVVLSCKKLTSLDISSNNLGLAFGDGDALVTLADALLRHPAITSLNILGNRLRREPASQFITALDKSTTLRMLCGFDAEISMLYAVPLLPTSCQL